MSDLLNQASLVMIPSGYKEDTVYSQIPQDGSGDLSFTRASNGTRINSAGLVEDCPWNLITYSEQFQNADWTGGGTGTPTMTDNFAEAPNGTMTASKIEAVSDGYQLRQNNARENTQMNLSVWLRTNTGTKTIQLFLNNRNTASQNITVTTTWTRYEISGLVTSLSGSGRNGLNTLEALTSSNYILVWGFQLSVGLTAKPYFPTTDRLNVPRLTYQNGGGGCPSLLLEKQSTNLLLRSEEFDSASWTKNGATITANTVTSPDGTQNADTLTGTSGNYRIYQIVSGLSSVDYTFSVFAKKGTANLIWFDFINVGDGPSFNFTTKAWSSASGWTTSYEEHANGWFRLIVTKASNTTSAGLGIKVGAVNETVYLWGAQMEASSYKTSYIQTTSSSATRVADACFKTGISSLIGQTEGTIFLDAYFDDLDTVNFSISDGTSGNYVLIDSSSGAVVFARVQQGGVTQATINTSASFYTVGARLKCAIAYKANDFAFYINGTLIGTDNLGTVPACDQIRFARWNGVLPATQRVNEVVISKTRLTNAELASLTTI